MEPEQPEEPWDMEIFDEQTSRDFKEQHMKDMDEAARTIRSQGWMKRGKLTAAAAAAAGDEGQQEQPPQASTPTSKGLMGKLSSASSIFSKKTTSKQTASGPPPPPRTSVEATTTPITTPPPPQSSTRQTITATTTQDTPATPSTSTAEAVPPEIKVLPFEVREPSIGVSVVGQLVILEGSCYVWAAAEGSAAQGSLAAAVGTRFDGGMPVATPLLAGAAMAGGAPVAGGAGGGSGGGSGGVGVSMAQRLCKRTGRVVFVSCDLPEESQLLVAAVEGKVVKMLKADEAGEGV